MASRHEAIQQKVILLWTREKRGRLYKMVQGTAVPVGRDHPVNFGPLKGLKGFPDLVGFEYINGLPIFCTVEIKTRNDSLSVHQRRVMKFLVSVGCRCYVAKENKNDDDYTIERWRG